MTLRPRRLILWSCVVWVVTMACLVFAGTVWANYERQERRLKPGASFERESRFHAGGDIPVTSPSPRAVETTDAGSVRARIQNTETVALSRIVRSDPAREVQRDWGLLKTEPGSYQSRTLPSKTEAPSGRRSGAGTFDRAAEVKIPRVPSNVTGWRDSHFTPWRGDYLAAQHLCGLDVRLIAAVVKAESGGDPWALSSSGARGLMQVKPTTAAELGRFDLWIPAQNLAAGSCYLRGLIYRRQGNVREALMDYVAGPYRTRTSAQTLAYAESIMENAQ